MLIESPEPEIEPDEAPQDETDAVEVEAEADEPEVEALEADEAEEITDEADAEEEPDADDEPDPGNLHTVNVDGEEKRVTLDELRRGYSGQAYVQRGMQQNAELQKQIKAQAESLNAERQAILQAAQSLQTGLAPAPTPPDPHLAETDPVAWMQENARFQQASAQYQEQQQQFAAIQQQEAQAQQAAQAQMMRENASKLVELIPEFSDPQKAADIRGKLVQAGSHYGYTQAEVEGVMDARAVAILNDARQWRELQASAPKTQKAVQNARPVVKPGAKKATRKNARKDAIGKAMRTQSNDDWAAALATE